jgi:hypothetical protein
VLSAQRPKRRQPYRIRFTVVRIDAAMLTSVSPWFGVQSLGFRLPHRQKPATTQAKAGVPTNIRHQMDSAPSRLWSRSAFTVVRIDAAMLTSVSPCSSARCPVLSAQEVAVVRYG